MKTLLPLVMLALLVPYPVANALSDDERWMRNMDTELKEIAVQLDRAAANNNEAALLPWLPERLDDMDAETAACDAEAAERLAILEEAINALGPAQPVEEASLARRRLSLNNELRTMRATQAECRLMNLDIRQINDRLEAFLQERLADRMLARGPALWETLASIIGKPEVLIDTVRAYWRGSPGTDSRSAVESILLIFTALLLGALLGQMMRSTISKRLERLTRGGLPRRMLRLLSRRLTVAFASLGIGLAALTVGTPIISLFALPMAAYWFISPLLRAWLCLPTDASQSSDDAEPRGEDSCRIANTLRPAIALAMIWIAGISLAGEVQIADTSVQLLRHVYAAIFALLLARVAWLVFELPAMGPWRFWRLPILIAVLAPSLAQFLGYTRLGLFLFNGVVGSLLALVAVIVLGQLWFYLLDSFNEGRSLFDRRIRRWIGFRDDEPVRISGWMKLIGVLFLAFSLLIAAMHAWGVPDAALSRFMDVFMHGFEVGSFTIVPMRLLLAILGFTLLMVLSGWLRAQLSERWLAGKNVDSGAREAITNLSVYTLVAIAVLMSLNIAGVDLGNLAIIAGALSVGIGFGLQNIVSNFVSGLILLFERPIRPGDWIVVGNTEGYVKKINIRYTQVQTFDRSDVIVPNSELLSTQVTNWMLRDNFGRVIVPVPVAYNSDTDQVQDILLKAARAHPLVMTNDARVFAPMVLFMGYGENSLNFELRAFIRDIDYRLTVRSDLHFSINRALREAGVEIPLPRREVNFRSSLTVEENETDRPATVEGKDSGA